MPILDSVIGAGAQLGSSIINSISANAMQKKQFAQQQELYDKQFEQQKQMIAEQNAYNSPANQRKLLEEAGLNPMLMYQNGTSNSIQSEVAKPEVAQAPLPIGAGSSIATGIDKSLQTMMSLAQIRQLEANTKKTEAETEGTNITNSRLGEQLDATISNLRQQTEVGKSTVNLNSQQWKLINEQITTEAVRREQMKAETEGIRVSAQEARTRIVNNMLEASLVSLRSALMQSQIDLNQSTISRQQAQTLLDTWEYRFRDMWSVPSSSIDWKTSLALMSGRNFGRSVENIFNLGKRLGEVDFKQFLGNVVNNVGGILNKIDEPLRQRSENFKGHIRYFKDMYLNH